jgi:glycosyltransferase involved in cell wall biosynthesis
MTSHENAVIAEHFDTEFYRLQVPALGDQDPILHFMGDGWRSGFDPNRDFSVRDYLNSHPDVAAAGCNPFYHYLTQGRLENRVTHASRRDKNGMDPEQAARIRAEGMLDRDFYLSHNPDVAAAGLDPVVHYFEFGWRERRDPNAQFNTQAYLAQHPELGPDDNPLLHFALHSPEAAVADEPSADPLSAAFDRNFYLQIYPDVAAARVDPFEHFMHHGWREGRDPSAHFSTAHYLDSNADVAAAGMNPLEHYVLFGKAEGRAPLPAWRSIAKDRGDILFVTHDLGVGGAPAVLQSLARWFKISTKFGVKMVAMDGGAREFTFRKDFPVLNLARYQGQPREELVKAIKDFVGPNIRCVFVNSVASGGFFDLWDKDDTPIISYINELFNVIELFGDNIQKVVERSALVVGCSKRVCSALRFGYGVPENRLRLVYSFLDSQAGVPAPTSESRAATRRKFGVDADDVYVVMACGVVHWRKSPDKFVELAAQVRVRTERPLKFIWLGDGEDIPQCLAMARKLGVADIMLFPGHSEDVARDLHAADAFVLTSEEDPFPLVCMHGALAGAPVICFERAGGMPEFSGQGAGTAVPFGDIPAMAAAVARYGDDASLRRAHGERARALALAKHTVDYAGPRFLELVREVTGVKPYVSVIVPNYNYGEYLPQRLASIYGQTFRDYEVILLDDASPDGSGAILEQTAREQPLTRYFANDRNSGSPFAQWLKGMDQASGELIWIAEADDFCAPTLLESLLPRMQDRNVFFGFAHSTPIGPDGNVLGDYRPIYLDRIAKDRWLHSYEATDHEEIQASLAVANSVPNASAVLFRNFDAEPEFRAAVTSMRMCGDWYFYIRAIRGGKVAFRHESLNFHRRHGKTVTQQTEGSLRYFDELRDTRRLVSGSYRIDPETAAKADRFTVEDLDRFGITDEGRRSEIIEGARYGAGDKHKPTLLVVASDLGPGGGQMFSIRLANAWAEAGGRAILLNAAAYPSHPNVETMISPRVSVYSASDADATLQNLVARFDVDVVHSSIWWADRLVHSQLGAVVRRPKWVVSMHGCYETLIEHPDVDPSFASRLPDMLRVVDHWVYTADKNLKAFEAYGHPPSLSKITNGFAPKPPKPLSRDALGLRPDALVVCLASRAIESKGWRQAVAAVTQLNAEGLKVDLMLFGEGPEADRLSGETAAYVKLMGQVSNLEDYIAVADVGLLPSYFIGESMPLVLIEYMAQGKPVVATAVGEIASMMVGPEGPAGVLLDLEFGTAPVRGIKSALTMLSNEPERWRLGAVAESQFQRLFSMDRMLSAYEALYRT